ncbi:MAG: CPBP family intramembrane metalloprotease [Alphaproteobacteria bacterium]|nr:CPBP family intramembrane metalloprotease [Alphaproteobacteria bacterium]
MGLVLGDDGKLRWFWRAAIFYGLAFWGIPYLARPLAEWAFAALGIRDGFSAGVIAFSEVFQFLVVLIPTAAFAWYERRRVDGYGLDIAKALRAPTFEGLIVGVVMAGAVGLGIYLLGGMQVRGFAGTGALTILAWAGANILIGVSEEFWFRHYFLYSLWRSIGFWPGALVIAAVFAAIHYFNKPGENISDVVTLVAFSLLCSYGVLRADTLWFAVGLHAAFDFMQLVVIGTPNGGQFVDGRLLDATFNGPAWLTGGSLGTEASWLMYPVFVLAFLYVTWRYRPAAATTAAPP